MPTDQLETLYPFLTSLAIGLLIGLERERSPAARAGLGLSRWLRWPAPWARCCPRRPGHLVLGAGLMVMGGMMVATYFKDTGSDDPGTTTVAAVVVCYALGALVWFDLEQLAVTLAILTTALLYFKPELRGVSRNLTRLDLVSILQFAVLSFVILPILPNQDYGPYDALNPYQIWWMVVLISGLSLAGYAALRVAGQRHGTLLTGLFGGIASSTATTLVFSRHGRDSPQLAGMAALVILLANWVVLIRLSILIAVLAPGLLRPMLTLLGGGALAGLVMIYLAWRRLGSQDDAPLLEMKNPTEIRAALSFGLLYAVVLFAAAWLSDWVGSQGVYAVALVSGLTDVDVITLSSLRLFNLGNLQGHQATTAILLAVLANIAFKSGLAVVIGGGTLARRVLPGMAAVAAGLVLGWLLS